MCGGFMSLWRTVRSEPFLRLGHVIKKQYLCSVFRKKAIKHTAEQIVELSKESDKEKFDKRNYKERLTDRSTT